MAAETAVIDVDGLRALIGQLRADGFTVLGPTRRDGAILYDELESVDDLPRGWTDEQEAGHYRLRRRDDDAFFGYVVGPQSPKRELFPSRTLLWEAEREGRGFRVQEPEPDQRAIAFFGTRSCELIAMAVQDRVFMQSAQPDPLYSDRRSRSFVVAVNCTEPGGTCFCTSMGTGPRATTGFDLALTELLDRHGHRFLVEVGSDAGRAVLERLPHRAAESLDVDTAQRRLDDAADSMGRTLQAEGLRDVLAANLEHDRWDDVASRCLACTNCTLVCPTCFCSTVEDTTDLTGDHAERWRRWDSCFTLGHSHMHGGSVRSTIRARYRQWLTHKFGTWHDQYGVSGCVGCGRCITWCPVGIDVTEELTAIREGPA